MPEPYSISLLNDSFPPLIDGVANTVVNYARELTKLGDRAIVVTPATAAFPFQWPAIPAWIPGGCSAIWRAIPFPRRPCGS